MREKDNRDENKWVFIRCSYREKWQTRNVIQRANIKIHEQGGCEGTHGEQDDEEADEEEKFAFTAAEIVTATNAAALRTRGRIIMR